MNMFVALQFRLTPHLFSNRLTSDVYPTQVSFVQTTSSFIKDHL